MVELFNHRRLTVLVSSLGFCASVTAPAPTQITVNSPEDILLSAPPEPNASVCCVSLSRLSQTERRGLFRREENKFPEENVSGHMIRICGRSDWLQIGRRAMDADVRQQTRSISPQSGPTARKPGAAGKDMDFSLDQDVWDKNITQQEKGEKEKKKNRPTCTLTCARG